MSCIRNFHKPRASISSISFGSKAGNSGNPAAPKAGGAGHSLQYGRGRDGRHLRGCPAVSTSTFWRWHGNNWKYVFGFLRTAAFARQQKQQGHGQKGLGLPLPPAPPLLHVGHTSAWQISPQLWPGHNKFCNFFKWILKINKIVWRWVSISPLSKWANNLQGPPSSPVPQSPSPVFLISPLALFSLEVETFDGISRIQSIENEALTAK